MKFIGAKEARARFNESMAFIDSVKVSRVVEDIMDRIAEVCVTRNEICVSFAFLPGDGGCEYDIAFPTGFSERFAYQWNDGSLRIRLTAAENSAVEQALEDGHYMLKIVAEGTTFRNISVSW